MTRGLSATRQPQVTMIKVSFCSSTNTWEFSDYCVSIEPVYPTRTSCDEARTSCITRHTGWQHAYTILLCEASNSAGSHTAGSPKLGMSFVELGRARVLRLGIYRWILSDESTINHHNISDGERRSVPNGMHDSLMM